MYDSERRINCHICRNIYCTCPPPEIDHADLAAMNQSRYSRKSAAATSAKNYDKPWLQNSKASSSSSVRRDQQQQFSDTSSMNADTSSSVLRAPRAPRASGKTSSAVTMSARREATKLAIQNQRKNQSTIHHQQTNATDPSHRSSSVKLDREMSSSTSSVGEKFHRANTSRPSLPLSPPPQIHHQQSVPADSSTSRISQSTPPPKAKPNSTSSRREQRSATPTSRSGNNNSNTRSSSATRRNTTTTAATPQRNRSSTLVSRKAETSSNTENVNTSTTAHHQSSNNNNNDQQPIDTAPMMTRQMTVTLDLEQTGRSLLVSTEREAVTTLYLRWKAFKKEIQRDLELRSQLQHRNQQQQELSSVVLVLSESEAHGRKVVRELEYDVRKELFDWYRSEMKSKIQNERKMQEIEKAYLQQQQQQRQNMQNTNSLNMSLTSTGFENDATTIVEVSPDSKMVSPQKTTITTKTNDIDSPKSSPSRTATKDLPPLSPSKNRKVQQDLKHKPLEISDDEDDDDNDSFTLSDTENDSTNATNAKSSSSTLKKQNSSSASSSTLNTNDLPVVPVDDNSGDGSSSPSTPTTQRHLTSSNRRHEKSNDDLLTPSAAGNRTDDVESIAPKKDEDEEEEKKNNKKSSSRTSSAQRRKTTPRRSSSSSSTKRDRSSSLKKKKKEETKEEEQEDPNVEKVKLPSPVKEAERENAENPTESSPEDDDDSKLPPILNPRAGWQQVVWSGGSMVANGVARAAKVPFWCLKGVVGISAKPATIVNLDSSDSELDEDEEQKEIQNRFRAKRTFDPAKDVIEKKEDEELRVKQQQEQKQQRTGDDSSETTQEQQEKEIEKREGSVTEDIDE